MANTSKTVIVTGGSQGIGSGAVQAFLDRDYNVVATSRNVTKSKDLPSSPKLAGGRRYCGSHYCRKSGGNSYRHIRLD